MTVIYIGLALGVVVLIGRLYRSRLAWCPTCNQSVSPVFPADRSGCLPILLVLFGAGLVFAHPVLGLALAAAGILWLAGSVVADLLSLVAVGRCPICGGAVHRKAREPRYDGPGAFPDPWRPGTHRTAPAELNAADESPETYRQT